jgi:hypothetical protein
MYLHLRVQDAPAAGLYAACGWQEVGRDVWLVRLLGQDQMRLMRKQLEPPSKSRVASGGVGGGL